MVETRKGWGGMGGVWGLWGEGREGCICKKITARKQLLIG